MNRKRKYISWFPELKHLDYKNCRSGWTEKYRIDEKQIKPRNSVWCKAKVEIKEVWSGRDKIEQQQWHEYGVKTVELW